MKTLVVIAILAAVAAFAGETVTVGDIEPPSPYNAKWNLFRSGEVRCDRAGLDCYGSNDNAFLIYQGSAINLAGYDGVEMYISYMQEAADDGDYCQLFLAGEDHNYTPFYTFENDADGGAVMLMLDKYYGARELGIEFVWVSDETGVAKGFRLYDLEIYGINWGQGEYENIFTWDATSDVTGHQHIGVDWMLIHPNMNCLSFEYGADPDTQGWWAVDNVDLTAGGVSVLPLQAGGYGVEDFESGGWHQYQIGGLPGEWEIDTDHATGDMFGANWQCDSAAHPGWGYKAETFSPWAVLENDQMIGVDFDTWFHPLGVGEYAKLGVYSSGSDERLMYLEMFHNLYDWYAGDYGYEVTETSWGAIKASF